MSDAVFKRKYTSANSYKNRRRKLQDCNGSEAPPSPVPPSASASPSTSKVVSKMQTRTGSLVSEASINENIAHDDTPTKPRDSEISRDHPNDDTTDKAKDRETDAQSPQRQTQNALAKRTYAKMRSYQNDAPSTNWMDEPVREGYSELRKRWGVDDSDEEDDPRSTHKSFSQLRSAGISRRYDEELSYICEGFVGDSSSVRRSSALSVSQKLSNLDWKKWLLDSEECLDRVWSGITQHLGSGDAIFDAISSIIIAHLSQSITVSPLAALDPPFCRAINTLYNTNNSNDVFRMSDKFLSRSERPLLREVKAVAKGVLEGEESITVPKLLIYAAQGIGEYSSLRDYSDVVDVALDAFDRARVVSEEHPYTMRLMKVIERSGESATFAMFKKLAILFGWMADQDDCSQDDIKSITRAMVTLSVDRRDTAKHIFATGRVTGDALTLLSQHQAAGHQDAVTLLLGLLMNMIELGGDNVADVFNAITEDQIIVEIFNTNHLQLKNEDGEKNETDVQAMSPKVVLCTLASCILSNCVVAVPGYAQQISQQVSLTDTTNVLRLNLVLDESDKASRLVREVERVLNTL